jgi:hypothetical protein
VELVFKISTFFKRKYGEEAEIDEFCDSICEIVKRKEYSSKVNRIDMIPSILPEELRQQGKGKEFTKIELKYKVLAICRQMDFELYQNSSNQDKKDQLRNCLIRALDEVKKTIGFDMVEFKKDIESVK